MGRRRERHLPGRTGRRGTATMTLLPLIPLLPLMLLSVRAAAQPHTYRDTDPVTGERVECDMCPPGTYLRARCTATRGSVCAPCPRGTFTELWNHIGKCLRCRGCGHDQVVMTPCAPDSDCRCQCRPGFYYVEQNDMCKRHSACASGHGVLAAGTTKEDTVCQACPNGTFSDTKSAHQRCTEHRYCEAAGLEVMLKGSGWHNNMCVNCTQLRSTDGAEYLIEILPAFFAHQRLSVRRLRCFVRNLLSADGRKQAGTSSLSPLELHARVDTWVASATPERIRQLPVFLKKVGATSASNRLQHKLQQIDAGLKELCALAHEMDVDVLSE